MIISLQRYYSLLHNNNDNIDDSDITLVDVGEDVLPLTTSLCYSPFHNNDFYDNDDSIDDISNTKVDNVCIDPSNSTRSTHFNITGDVVVSVIPISY